MTEKFQHLNTHNKQIMQNVIGASIVKGGSIIVAVAIFPMYLDFFKNQTMLGAWFTILSVLNMFVLFDLGLGHGLRNKLSKIIECRGCKSIKEVISTTYILILSIAVIVTTAGMFIIPCLNWNIIFNGDPQIINNSILISVV